MSNETSGEQRGRSAEAVQVTDRANAHFGRVGRVLKKEEEASVAVRFDDGEIVHLTPSQIGIPPDRTTHWLRLIAMLLGGAAVAVWVIVLNRHDVARLGAAGDAVAFVTSLLSMIAVFAALRSIDLQRQELALQREEMANSRTELARQANSMEGQLDASRELAEAMRAQAKSLADGLRASAAVQMFDAHTRYASTREKLLNDMLLTVAGPSNAMAAVLAVERWLHAASEDLANVPDLYADRLLHKMLAEQRDPVYLDLRKKCERAGQLGLLNTTMRHVITIARLDAGFSAALGELPADGTTKPPDPPEGEPGGQSESPAGDSHPTSEGGGNV
ncbi:MAG: hypothetical protein AB7S26_42960 [Sandaracinaceae bacterium]